MLYIQFYSSVDQFDGSSKTSMVKCYLYSNFYNYYRLNLNNVKDINLFQFFLWHIFLNFSLGCYSKQIASVVIRERADTAYPVL